MKAEDWYKLADFLENVRVIVLWLAGGMGLTALGLGWSELQSDCVQTLAPQGEECQSTLTWAVVIFFGASVLALVILAGPPLCRDHAEELRRERGS